MTGQADRRDLSILRLLQSNCQRAIAEIGDRVGLSTSACHRRIKHLEESRTIEGYVAKLNPKKLGFSMNVIVEVSLVSQSDRVLEAFEQAISDEPEILECHLMAGEADYILRLAAKGPEDFERQHREVISRLPGVAKVKSNPILRTVKKWSGYHL